MEEVVEDAESRQDESGTFIPQKECIQDNDVTTTAVGLCNEESPQNMTTENKQGMYNAGEAEFEESSVAEADAVMIPAGHPESSIPISQIEDVEDKLSEGEVSPPMDDNLGRRKRKPSRYHDSMFDIPTNLLNINRTINPEEFRAFHSKQVKQKEKIKKVIATPPPFMKPKTVKQEIVQESKAPPLQVPTEPSPSYSDFEDDVLDPTNTFKFKMRKDHLVQNTMGGPTAYKCDVCLMTFPRSFSLRRHYTRRHINPKYAPVKTEGPPGNEIAGNLPQAPADIYGTAKEKFLYACKMCSKELIYFKHKSELHMHCLEQHTTEPRRHVNVFKCDICKRSYSTRHELERHKRTHSGERPYSCSYCQKTFPTSTNARRHERTHTGDRPHICKVCNKGFIQRTDMVKHLRSIHKMKVTKTKAQKSGFPMNMERIGNRNSESGFGMDVNNEFQEDIDFAAYLRLDQHINGTLMGEEASRPSLPGKGACSSKDNNGHPQNNNHLKDLPPSQIVGEDGKLEKVHRCPDCSKMFTNNINLRRHYKLKHERNQIYQSAEPVSMVVEKFKIMDDTVGKEGEKMKGAVDCSNNATEVTSNNLKITDQDGAYHQNKVVDEKPATEDMLVSIDTSRKNDEKVGKHSKLSSIVQRLASKISAGQSTTSDGEVNPASVQETLPITQLEEFGDNIFSQSAIKSDTISPKRNKRKPTNVHHVPIKESPKEIMQDEVKHKSILPDKYKQQQKLRRHQMMSQHERPSTSVGGIYRKIFESGSPLRHPDRMKMHGYEDYSLKDLMHSATTSHGLDSGFRSHDVRKSDSHIKEATDLSKMGISHPRDVMMSSERHYPPSIPHRREASRMETFLSQCYSSKKYDIPQNAVLDKNLPLRDSHSMTKKLKYNMKNLSNARKNEHLPPSAYFSQRDRVFSPGPQTGSSNDQATQERKHSTDSEAPLDLRIPSKKPSQDYVVRDDGVLDFSQKTRNSLEQSKQKVDSPRISSPDHPRVKIEPFRNMPVYPDRRHNEPYSRQFAEDIPPWLQSSHQKFMSQGRLEQHMNPMMDSRRDLLHGRPTTSKQHKPYKFHCMDYKAPYRDPSSPMDPKARMSRPQTSYRDHPYLPMHPPGPSSMAMGRRRYTPPHMYAPQKEDSRRYSSDKMMTGRMMHKHYPPSSQYHAGNIPVPRYAHQSREIPPSYPGQSSNKNWQRDHRRESQMSHADHSTAQSNNLRHILPKGGWKDDMIAKSVWKEEPRPIPSSIQRLALKRSQRASPFDRWDIFDDKDMMNRCIKKAQQSLKKEPANENLKQTKEIFNRDAIAFKENPNLPDYLKKLDDEKLMSRGIPPSKIFVTTSSPMQTRSPPFIRPPSTTRTNPSMPHTKTDSGVDMYGMLNLTSSMKSPQPYEHENEQEHETPVKESHGRVNEVSQEEVHEREKLTMTPGLESSHDTIELTTIKTDDDCDENTNVDNTREVTNEGHQVSMDFAATEHSEFDTPKDLTSDIDEIHSMRPAFVDTRQSSGKVVSRRHTHAHPGDDSFLSGDIDAALSGQKCVLKRSCSNDSNQCDSLSDEGDGSSRKIIKKLKLRVIKSPGSEHKKYWTLVDQDRPLMNTLAPESDLPASSEQHEKQVQSCDDGNEKTCSDLVEAKKDDSKGAEIPLNDEQVDLTSHTNDTDLAVHQDSESITSDVLVQEKADIIQDEVAEPVKSDISTNDEAKTESVNANAVTESMVETPSLSIDNIEVEDTTNIDEDKKSNETELSKREDEAISKLSDATGDIEPNPPTTESSLPDEDQSGTITLDIPLPGTDSKTVRKQASNPVDSETETPAYTDKSVTPQNDTISDSLPDISTKVPESNVKIVRPSESVTVPPTSRTTRSGGLSAVGVRSDKKLSSGNANGKKTDASSGEPTSNRLRRSVRIRETSSDKDAVTKKKK